MTIEEKVQAILVATPAVTSVVPANRIRVGGEWQNLELPYAVHFPVAWGPQRTHDGLDTLQLCEIYQLSIFGTKYSSARNAVLPIIQALEGVHSDGTTIHWRGGPRYLRDNETKTEYFILEFRVHSSLS